MRRGSLGRFRLLLMLGRQIGGGGFFPKGGFFLFAGSGSLRRVGI